VATQAYWAGGDGAEAPQDAAAAQLKAAAPPHTRDCGPARGGPARDQLRGPAAVPAAAFDLEYLQSCYEDEVRGGPAAGGRGAARGGAAGGWAAVPRRPPEDARGRASALRRACRAPAALHAVRPMLAPS
jgi:hypothetical protein